MVKVEEVHQEMRDMCDEVIESGSWIGGQKLGLVGAEGGLEELVTNHAPEYGQKVGHEGVGGKIVSSGTTGLGGRAARFCWRKVD